MNPVVEKISTEIGQQGAIPFRRFMELALYCPVYGYYEKEGDTVGRQGDYFTSVSSGSLFGELLAWQFAEWLPEPEAGGAESKVGNSKSVIHPPVGFGGILEAGAHRGELARDILTWLRECRPGMFAQLEYWIAEPSARRRQWQKETLRGFTAKVRWVGDLRELGANQFRGVIFSNELLDALPVHRLGWDKGAKKWFEWGVNAREGRFIWTKLSRTGGDRVETWPEVPPELAAVLPEGFTVEVCPAACDWWRLAANALARGKLIAIDYGLGADELFSPERKEGTLRAYRRHRLSRDVLADPGQQDITAHVDFSVLKRVGEAAGLMTENLISQAQFLTGIAARVWKSDRGFGEWTPQHKRQFQTLTHPEHLGRAFRVLVQTKG